MKNLQLEISRLIGEPVDIRKPVAFELGAVADILPPAEPGEKVWIYSSVDDEAEYILAVDGDGVITTIKKNPLGDTQISFTGFNSRMEYVLVDDVLGSPDTQVLARKKEKITRGLDKRELQLLINAIEGSSDTGNFQNNLPSGASIQSRDAVTGEDLYDVFIAMKHLLEDYGDNFIALVGSTVKEKIDTYEKENAEAGGFTYRVGLKEMLKDVGIEVVKVFGKVHNGSSDAVLLDTNHIIMVAKNSRLAQGKPVKFVRRRISPEIAKLMGADIDNAQRATIVGNTPVIADPGVSGSTVSNLLAYSIYAYESLVMAIVNPLAICTSDATLAV